ncbi:MAG: hypothetical protein LC799_35345, partial [Actinobacteria bacterium]|nr:hypothetical protein [Actinomycetota bacterium]
LSVGGMPARTHASQGEQRSLALALRLASHDVVTEVVGEPPLLLLDDVFSELDSGRSQALLDHLPEGQSVLTTTGDIPPAATPHRVVSIQDGRIVAAKPQTQRPGVGLGPERPPERGSGPHAREEGGPGSVPERSGGAPPGAAKPQTAQ